MNDKGVNNWTPVVKGRERRIEKKETWFNEYQKAKEKKIRSTGRIQKAQ